MFSFVGYIACVTLRTDFQKLDLKKSKKATGGLALKGYLTRCGVFEYKDSNGAVTRELRHPDEVFSPDSLESLQNAPVVVGHPDMVTERNWKRHAAGNVGSDVRAVKSFVAATVFVNDSEAIEAVEAGNLVELSCGYSCELENSSGIYDGQPYDKIQRNIQYNHVGMGPEDWGRAGKNVRLYFDSKESWAGGYIADMPKEVKTDNVATSETVAPSPEVVAATEVVTPENKSLTQADFDAIRGQLVAAESKIEELLKKINAAPAEKSLDSIISERVASRVELFRVADREGVELKSDASDDACRVEILKKVSPRAAEKCDGESSEFVRAAFEMALLDRPAKVLGAQASEIVAAKVDSREDSLSKAHKELNDTLVNAWKGKK